MAELTQISQGKSVTQVNLKQRLIFAASAIGVLVLVSPALTFAASSTSPVVSSSALKLGISSFSSTSMTGTAVVHNVPPPAGQVEILWFATNAKPSQATPGTLVGKEKNKGKYTDVFFKLTGGEPQSGYPRAYDVNGPASNYSKPLQMPILSMPYGDLPEMPYAVALPLIMIVAFGIFQIRMPRNKPVTRVA